MIKFLSVISLIFTLTDIGFASSQKTPWDDPTCNMSKIKIYNNPKELLEEFLKNDGNGLFIESSALFDSAFLCPGHMGAPDQTKVISSFSIISSDVKKDSAYFLVRFAEVGILYSGGKSGELNKFDVDKKTVNTKFILVKTPFGWKIKESGSEMPRVLSNFIEKIILHRDWVSGDYEKFKAAIMNERTMK